MRFHHADCQFENALVCPGDDPANCYTSLEASPTPRGPVPDATSAKEDSIGSSRTRREIVMEDVIEGSGESSGGSGSGEINQNYEYIDFDEINITNDLKEVMNHGLRCTSFKLIIRIIRSYSTSVSHLLLINSLNWKLENIYACIW